MEVVGEGRRAALARDRGEEEDLQRTRAEHRDMLIYSDLSTLSSSTHSINLYDLNTMTTITTTNQWHIL